MIPAFNKNKYKDLVLGFTKNTSITNLINDKFPQFPQLTQLTQKTKQISNSYSARKQVKSPTMDENWLRSSAKNKDSSNILLNTKSMKNSKS